jgi:hypothetical protein
MVVTVVPPSTSRKVAFVGSDRLIEFQRIDDLEYGIGIDDEPPLIRQDHLLRRRFDVQKPLLIHDDILDEGNLELEPGGPIDPRHRPELEHDRLFGFADGEIRLGQDQQCRDDGDARDDEVACDLHGHGALAGDVGAGWPLSPGNGK